MNNDKYQVGILINAELPDHLYWLKACAAHKNSVSYYVINLLESNWLKNLYDTRCDFFLAKPPGLIALHKQIYDERIQIIDQVLKIPIYPTPQEIFIYENKRYFYSWLLANNLPHPRTVVFSDKKDALNFVNQSSYPLVAKVNIGASGSGVYFLKDTPEAIKYIEQSFSKKGAPRRWGPNLSKGGVFKRGFHYIRHPEDIRKKTARYMAVRADRQTGFVIFQEHVPHVYEWRIVAIGGSYFAHKKLKIGEKASGSTLKNYDNPHVKLFDFAKHIMEKFGFLSQAIDVFETSEGKLLINEMQCIFGQSDPYQMLVDGKPGKYVYQNETWVFEPGDFNANESYNLRLKAAIEEYKKR